MEGKSLHLNWGGLTSSFTKITYNGKEYDKKELWLEF